MSFVSVQFVCLFTTVLLLYFQLPPPWRNRLLLAASATFYMWWRPEYVLIILFSVTVDYFIALALEKRTDGRKALLVFSLISNLGLLFFFKYYDFAAENLRAFFGFAGIPLQPPGLNLILPIGISFHTFQALSYTIDVYRRQIPVERSLPKLWLYVLFFPQLVAGPIERAGRLLPQFDRVHPFDDARVREGLRLVLWGFIKKVAVADRLALMVDPIFQMPGKYAGLTVLLAIWGFSIQIYADFSGYSDIARGTARVLGFELMENFKRPYLAASVQDFWKRWHISLSTWFRDYVYIPLGGNASHLALISTFLLSGLWHGARWTFVVWGAYHAALLLLSRMIRGSKLIIISLPSWLRILFTFNLVSLGWVFFRTPSIADALTMFRNLCDLQRSTPTAAVPLGPGGLFPTIVAMVALLAGDLHLEFGKGKAWPWGLRWAAYVVGTVLVFSCGTGQEVPFIYFQF